MIPSDSGCFNTGDASTHVLGTNCCCNYGLKAEGPNPGDEQIPGSGTTSTLLQWSKNPDMPHNKCVKTSDGGSSQKENVNHILTCYDVIGLTDKDSKLKKDAKTNNWIIDYQGNDKNKIDKIVAQKIIKRNIQELINFMNYLNLDGLEFDMEGWQAEYQQNLIFFCNELKSYTKNNINQFSKNGGIGTKPVVMYTILLGSWSWWDQLLLRSDQKIKSSDSEYYADYETAHNAYDYLSLMLYNGGMYTKGGVGGMCTYWQQWAQLFLSGCDKNLNGICSKGQVNTNLEQFVERLEKEKGSNGTNY